MKLRFLFACALLLMVPGVSPVHATGGSATNVTVTSEDLASPGAPAVVQKVYAGPLTPPTGASLPPMTLADPTTFVLSGTWPINGQALTLGQVTVGVYGQVVGTVVVQTQDRLNPKNTRVDIPYYLALNTAGWTSADSNASPTQFLPYLYLQQTPTTATEFTNSSTANTAYPFYAVSIPTNSNTQVIDYPSATPNTDGIYATWPDSRDAGNTAQYTPASDIPSLLYWNASVGTPVPSTWTCYAELKNTTTNPPTYFATAVGSDELFSFPEASAAASYTNTSGTVNLPNPQTGTPPVFNNQGVSNGNSQPLPTAFSATVTNMYPGSRLFVRLYTPSDPTTNKDMGELPEIGPSTYYVDNGTTSAVTQSISFNPYSYVTASGTYEVDFCEFTPVDTAVSGAYPAMNSVYPVMQSPAGTNQIKVGTNAAYTPGLNVIYSYTFTVNYSVNVQGTIVNQ
jgi:hypothetical protein